MRLERIEWDGLSVRALVDRLRASADAPPGLSERVAAIIERIHSEGDAALLELCVELDGVERMPESLLVPADDVIAAYEALDPGLDAALRLAASNIRAVAEAELRPPVELELPQGHEISVLERPVGRAGLYAPGGRASYPSSVLMGLIPAHVAGVGRSVLVSPPRADGTLSPVVLASAHLGGVDEVYAMGGAHAIAALALGTDSIAPVDVIAGPGGPWVTEAKRQLYGAVGIDGLAGPSELVVVADAGADARQIALDALAQAEHGADSPIIIASEARALLDDVAAELGALAPERPSVADAPIALVEAPSIDNALVLSDAFAPEHLELRFEGASERAASRTAACVFVGEAGATAFGDYVAGSNHVLPTGGAARFSGPLGVATFRRRMSVVEISGASAGELADATDEIARAEGLPVHGESASASATRKTDDLQVT